MKPRRLARPVRPSLSAIARSLASNSRRSETSWPKAVSSQRPATRVAVRLTSTDNWRPARSIACSVTRWWASSRRSALA